MGASDLFQQLLKASNRSNFQLATRCHPLIGFREGRHQKSSGSRRVFVKRDDELGGLIGGSKWRKYATLLSHFEETGVETAVLVGSSASNNIASLGFLLKSMGVRPIMLVKESNNTNRKVHPNQFVSSLLGCEVRGIPAEEWGNVDEYAAQVAAEEQCGSRVEIVKEGAMHPASVVGAVSLGQDIISNETSAQAHWSDVFIDSGSGLTSASAALGMYIARYPESAPNMHVVHVAGGPSEWLKALEMAKAVIKSLDPRIPTDVDLKRIHHHFPPTARSFGAWNATILAEVVRNADNSGILTDPVYTAKLFLTAKHWDRKLATSSTSTSVNDVLLVHSGGQLSLIGYQDRIRI